MHKLVRRLSATGAAAAIGLAVLGDAAAQENFTLNFNHVLGPTEPYHAGFLKWAEPWGSGPMAG